MLLVIISLIIVAALKELFPKQQEVFPAEEEQRVPAVIATVPETLLKGE
jgi:hypothetical protein